MSAVLMSFYDGPLGGQRRTIPSESLDEGLVELSIIAASGVEVHVYKVELRPVLVWQGKR